MSAIVYIPNHADLAEARLPTQYVAQPKLTALVRAFGDRAQTLEDVLIDMVQNGGVLLGHDSLLDQIGDVVGQPRNGLTDTKYKTYLLAKITQNISRGTPEVLINLYKVLMGADRVYYNPIYPAGFSLTAVGSVPVGSTPDVPFSFFEDPDPAGEGFGDAINLDTGGTFSSAGGFSQAIKAAIQAALNASRIAGVSIDFFATAFPVAFSFSDDPDPAGQGFGDSTDSSVGGTLSEIF